MSGNVVVSNAARKLNPIGPSGNVLALTVDPDGDDDDEKEVKKPKKSPPPEDKKLEQLMAL
jgi:hypothetical protein